MVSKTICISKDVCCCCCLVALVVSDSVRPHRWQPTRLLCPWDAPGKNTGVGCHFLLQCMKVKSESEVTKSCPTPSDPMDCSLLGSSVHGIFQARVLEWGAIAFSKCSYHHYLIPDHFHQPQMKPHAPEQSPHSPLPSAMATARLKCLLLTNEP